jgi:hypothetical protein
MTQAATSHALTRPYRLVRIAVLEVQSMLTVRLVADQVRASEVFGRIGSLNKGSGLLDSFSVTERAEVSAQFFLHYFCWCAAYGAPSRRRAADEAIRHHEELFGCSFEYAAQFIERETAQKVRDQPFGAEQLVAPLVAALAQRAQRLVGSSVP